MGWEMETPLKGFKCPVLHGACLFAVSWYFKSLIFQGQDLASQPSMVNLYEIKSYADKIAWDRYQQNTWIHILDSQ